MLSRICCLLPMILCHIEAAASLRDRLTHLFERGGKEVSVAILPGRIWHGREPEVESAAARVLQRILGANLNAESQAQSVLGREASYLLQGTKGFVSGPIWGETPDWVLEMHQQEVRWASGAQHRARGIAVVSWIRALPTGTPGRAGLAVLDLSGRRAPWVIDSRLFPLKNWGDGFEAATPLISDDGRYFLFHSHVFRIERNTESLGATLLYSLEDVVRNRFEGHLIYALTVRAGGQFLMMSSNGENDREYAWVDFATGALISEPREVMVDGWQISDVLDRRDEPTFLMKDQETGTRLRRYRAGAFLPGEFVSEHFILDAVRVSPGGRYAIVAPQRQLRTPILVVDLDRLEGIGDPFTEFPKMEMTAVDLTASGFFGEKEEHLFLSAPSALGSGHFEEFSTQLVYRCRRALESSNKKKDGQRD